MKDVLSHINRLKQKLTSVQKMGILVVFGVVCACMVWLWVCAPFSAYEAIYPNQVLAEAEKQQVCAYLDAIGSDYQDKNGTIVVPSKYVERVKTDLLNHGISGQKTETGKGFELFDTNTWIKGEKELQVLEMRALKGQLEHDLTEFENIKRASVILDVPPTRTFGNQSLKTKASVILTLMPQAQLSLSQLRAVCYHLAGAVRGLEPRMIAVSDTKGRLYQAIDAKETSEISDQDIIVESHLKEDIESLLQTVLGEDNFYVSVRCAGAAAPDPCVAIVLNKHAMQENMQEELSRQIQTLGRGYSLTVEPTLDILPFERTRGLRKEPQSSNNYLGIAFLACSLLATIAFISSLLWWMRRNPKKEADVEAAIMTKIDIAKLASSLEEEDPETIAMMLTYLEPKKAEEILSAFPVPLQEQVLTELEKAS
ncbi:MAG: hypothetical protein JSS62_04105 [Verrucomicrobia bacterium]|nr:hypothetical protein [Verrucomicrobiota bacterium]MBS0645493.1 hypothetical protein [Verrucomicrobiota bacterium]